MRTRALRPTRATPGRARTQLPAPAAHDPTITCTTRARTHRARAIILTLVALIASVTACALPRWPIEGPVTSPFGLRLRGLRPDLHPGVDIAAPAGTPVHAMKAGTVAFAGAMSGYGLTVILDHDADTRTLYAHLSSILVQRGERVPRDSVLGLVGATGNATAPHLHFEIRRWGHNEDPVPLLGSRPRR